MEILERIAELATPQGDGRWERHPRPLKFRVTFRLLLPGKDAPHEESFSYQDLATAKRAYRDMLLGLYRARDIVAFAICLNRVGDGVWERAILREGE
jgi:hypothetical protein